MARNFSPLYFEYARRKVQDCENRVKSSPEWAQARYDAERVGLSLAEVDVIAYEALQATGHSRQYWFQLVRRALPALLIVYRSLVPPFPRDLEDILIRLASSFTLLLPITEPKEKVVASGSWGIQYDLGESERETLALLFVLADFKQRAQSTFRCVSKGIPLVDNREENPLWLSIQGYEQRRERYETIAGSAGLWYDPAQVAPLNLSLCGFWFAAGSVGEPFRVISKNPVHTIYANWILMPVLEKRQVSGAGVLGRSDFYPAPAGAGFSGMHRFPYDSLLQGIAEALEPAINITALALKTFLYGLYLLVREETCFELLDWEGSRSREIILNWPASADANFRGKVLKHLGDSCEMGMLKASPESWLRRLHGLISGLAVEYEDVAALAEPEIGRIFDILTLKHVNSTSADLPVIFTMLSPQTLVLDFLVAGDFIKNLLLVVSLNESRPSAGKKGILSAWQESQVATFFERELGLDREKMIISRPEVRNARTGQCRDVDLAFVYRSILFVIECKAMGKNYGYIAGEFGKIRNRSSRISVELREKIPERIDAIESGAVRPIIEPGTFSHGFGLVCTTAVEYLPLSEDLFWMRGCPLVGPPEELLKTIQVITEIGQ